MKFRAFCGMVFFWAAVLCPAVAAEPKPDLWLVKDAQDPDRAQWCAFHDEQGFNAFSDAVLASEWGLASYSKGRLTAVSEQSDFEGELRVDDFYFLDAQGRPERLRRDIYYFGFEMSETYQFQNGIPRKMETRIIDPHSGKPTKWPKELDRPSGGPIRKSMRTLPFYALIARPTVAQKTCISER